MSSRHWSVWKRDSEARTRIMGLEDLVPTWLSWARDSEADFLCCFGSRSCYVSQAGLSFLPLRIIGTRYHTWRQVRAGHAENL